MGNSKIKLLALSSLSVILLILSSCSSGQGASGSSTDDKQVIKIGYLPITHAVPLFIENEKKDTFENFDLELVQFGSWPELMDALNTGRIDGASVLITLAMKAKEQGIDLKAVALGHRDGNVLIVENEVERVEDLIGRNFAIPHEFSSHNILLYQMLKQAGLQYEDVNAIELPPAEMPAALSEGRIAGYVVAEPFGAFSVAINKGKVLYQDNEIWQNSIDCVLVLRDDFINNQNAAAEEFVAEYLKAGEIAERKDDYTLEASSKYMKVDEEVMDLSFEWIVYDDLKINEDSYELLTQHLTEMSLLDNPPTYEEFVDSSFVDQAE